MLLQTPFPSPPFPPGLPPPEPAGPVFQFFAALVALVLAGELIMCALPDLWARAVIRALLSRVWPFTRADTRLCERIK